MNSRYIPHANPQPSELNIKSARNDILDALYAGVRRVHRHSSSKESVFIGSAGPLLMDWRVSSVPDMQEYIPSKPSLPTSLKQPSDGGHASFLETSIGTATLHIILQIRAAASGSNVQSKPSSNVWKSCVQLIEQTIQLVVQGALNEDGCEVLYGRAGLLYTLLLLRSELSSLDSNVHDPVIDTVKDISSDANIAAVVNDIIRRGQAGAQSYSSSLSGEDAKRAPPLMWSWHGKRYLGAAHGIAGILHILISIPGQLLQPYWNLILDTIRWLVEIQQPSGNWPSQAGRHMHDAQDADEKYELIQWCHGAPGMLILLSTLLRRFATTSQSQGGLLEIPQHLVQPLYGSISRGGELVYARGFLRKGVGLCHGVAGTVFALLAVSDVLDSTAESSAGEDVWFRRAVHLSQLATTYHEYENNGEMSIPDFPYTLYGGVAGMCCAWMDILERLDGKRGTGMPGYGDLHTVD